MATLLMIESWLQSTGEALPALLRSLGHDDALVTRDPALYGAGSAARHPALAGAADVVVVETNDTAAVVERAAELAATRRIDGVLTTCDYYLATTAAVAARRPARGRRHAHRRPRRRPAPRLSARGQARRPQRRHVGAPGRRGGPPQRRLGRDHRPHPQHPRQALAGVVLLEEVLTGTEVSVEAVTVDGRTTVVALTDKSVTGPPAFVESGHMFPAALPPRVADDVADFATAALGLTHGLSHTEVMITAGGPRLVELNPRQGGGYIFDLVHLVTGAHPLRALVDLALGAAPVIGTAAAPLPGAAVPGGSAAVMFVMAPRPGRVVAVDGLDRLTADPQVHRWALPVPVDAARPVDNEAYLGHVVVLDPGGAGARAHAERLVGSLRLRFADGSTAPPLGVAGVTERPSPAAQRATARMAEQ